MTAGGDDDSDAAKEMDFDSDKVTIKVEKVVSDSEETKESKPLGT